MKFGIKEQTNNATMKKLILSIIALVILSPSIAQDKKDKKDKKDLPLEATRSLDINTDQGTWMSPSRWYKACL